MSKKISPLTPVQQIPNIGPVKMKILKEMGIQTAWNLLFLFPSRYFDRTNRQTLDQCKNDQYIHSIVSIDSIEPYNTSKKKITHIHVYDSKGQAQLIFYQNYSFFKNRFQPGQTIFISGKCKLLGNKKHIIHPDIDSDKNTTLSQFFCITPHYPTAQIPNKLMRKIMQYILHNMEHVSDPRPSQIQITYKLMPLIDCLQQLHLPESQIKIDKAKKSVAFLELFLWQLKIQKHVTTIQNINKMRHYPLALNQLSSYKDKLPFQLSLSQNKALLQIINDLQQKHPMRRLIHGDVGSGKSIIAFLSLIYAALNNYQTALIAPTEILAKQHYNNFCQLFPNFSDICFVSSHSKKLQIIEKITIGTHSAFQPNVFYTNLGLVVIDEQHKFGVAQKAKLLNKGKNPDLLMMSATPIPRSLAWTSFGHLKKSKILGSSNTGNIKTLILHHNQIEGIIKSIKKYLSQGRQGYWVFPTIHQSDSMPNTIPVTEGYENYSTKLLPFQSEILHGQMTPENKSKIVQRFSTNNIQLLFTTSIIEVGIHNQNATIMVIQNPERFGLSQLHQIRGRIGRGPHPSFCILLVNNQTPKSAAKRLHVLTEINNGFKIADQDLILRGPGDFLGTRQHGIPRFILADITNTESVMQSQKSIFQLLKKEMPKEIEKLFYLGFHINSNLWFARWQKLMNVSRETKN